MQTIIIKLDSEKLVNPDLDIIYYLPVRIEEYTDERVVDNGYDYITENIIGVWLETDNARAMYPVIIELLKREKFSYNDLSESAEIFISEDETAELDDCEKVYPEV